MRAELANLNHCAVPFLSRAAVNLSWYVCTKYLVPLCNSKLCLQGLKEAERHIPEHDDTIRLTKTTARKYSPRTLG